ncbi:MAG: hypothetical protein GEU99_23450 [Luteitalea sp.]|nr:hypothetical protein [Luteitalea sp.]
MQPLPPTPSPPADILATIADHSGEAIERFAPLFTSFGYDLFGSFAIISIAVYGIRTMLASAEGGGGLNLNELTRRLTLIGVVWIAIVYYNNPIPGIGINAHQIVTDQSYALAQELRSESMKDLFDVVNGLLRKNAHPGFTLDVARVLSYYYFLLLFLGAELAVIVIVGFGYVAVAVCILLGPVFVPFLLFANFDWLFWGWLKALLQFAFYQVIAEAYLHIMVNVLLGFQPRFDSYQGVYDTYGDAVALGIIFTVFIFSVFKLPALVAIIFTGGSAAFGAFGQGAATFVRQVAVRRLF